MPIAISSQDIQTLITKPGRVGTCCSCPRGTDGTSRDDCTEHHNRPKTVGKKTCPPYLTIDKPIAAEINKVKMTINNIEGDKK